MADQDRAVFTTELKAEGTAETQAQAQSVEKLRGELDRQIVAVGKMNQAYRGLKMGGHQTTKMGVDLKNRILEQKKAIGLNQQALLGMKGGLGITTDAMKKNAFATHGTTSALSRFSQGASFAGGPMSSLSSKVVNLSGLVGKGGLIAVFIAAAAALVGLDYAIIKTAISLGKMAISSADAYRSERLSIEGMTKVWRGFFGVAQRAPGNAELMQKSIDDVADRVPLLRDQVVSLNAQLYKYGLRGNSLKQALEAVAMGESAAGEEGKQMGINMIAGAAMFGRGVGNAVAVMKNKFGPIVEKQMLELPVQIAKAKYAFSQLFTGVKVEPLLRGLHNVLGLFNKGTETSKAWRAIFETLFNPLFAGAEKGSFTIKRFLQGVTIVALEAAIKFKALRGSFSLQSLGLGNTGQILEGMISGFSGLTVGILRGVQASLLLGDALARALSLSTLLIKLSPVGPIIAGIRKLNGTSFTEQFKGIADQATGLFKGDAATTGISLIQGMISGIEKGKPLLIQAARDAANAANEGAKQGLDSHSPSRKGIKLGYTFPQGQAIGIRRGIPEVQRASTDVARAALDAPRPTGGGGMSSGRASQSRSTPTIGQLHLHGLSASDKITLSVSELRNLLAQVLEGMAHQRGALAT